MDKIHECACHDSTNPTQRAVNTPRPPRQVPEPVTFGQFARAAERRGWSLDFLAKFFRGKIEDPGELLGRIFDRHQRHAGMVIPYASMLTFYHREMAAKRSRRPRKLAPGTPAVAASFPAKQPWDYLSPEPA